MMLIIKVCNYCHGSGYTWHHQPSGTWIKRKCVRCIGKRIIYETKGLAS